MPETLYHDITIAGPPGAIEAFLASHRVEADLTVPAPWKATSPILGVIGPTAGTEAGQPILRVGIRSSAAIDVPAGCWVSDLALAMGRLGMWASLEPTVPPSVTLLRFMRILARRGIITQDEALAATRTGAVPAAIDAVFATFPPDAAFDARLTWAAMYEVERANPLLELVGAMHGIDGPDWDDIFREAAL